MFLGHAALAFAMVALAARAAGTPPERALAAGALAGMFAAIPDLDVAYAPIGMTATLGGGAGVEAFWAASERTHRTLTHSLVLALPAAAGFALWPVRRRLAALALAGVVGVGVLADGLLGAAVLALFVGAGAAVATLAARRGIATRTTFLAALVGLVSHPFGDLFTGEPPQLFAPLGASVLDGRVAPFADPTLNLLAAFGVELGALWLGAATVVWLSERRMRDHVNPRAVAGVGYAAVAPVVAPPTMAVSYHFVFSVLAVGFVGATPRRARLGRSALPHPLTAVCTGLAAVTLAALTYVAVYVAA